jgi:hypothetical protein
LTKGVFPLLSWHSLYIATYGLWRAGGGEVLREHFHSTLWDIVQISRRDHRNIVIKDKNKQGIVIVKR